MAAVEFRNVGKSFGQVEVLKGLNLAISAGEFIVLLGASGCGKTTLLRMTAGLESISEGEIAINGTVVNETHPRDRNIAMVFQNYALYPTMKVRDNIGFSLEVARKSPDEIQTRVEEVAQILNITDLLDRKPSELSGGQRQRVAMGRAMVRDADVFLFDEPLSNLDAKLRAHMRVEIRQLHDRLGSTTLYVTHDQIEAMTMADRIVLMHEGSIVQVGSTDDLYDRPNCRYTAEFIGTPAINCLDGKIETTSEGTRLTGLDSPLPLADGYRPHDGRSVTLGIRPNEMVIADGGALRGTIVIVEKTGTDMQFHMETADGTEFVAVVPRSTPGRPSDHLSFAIDPTSVHLFDRESGERIDA
ncbi:MAG: sn-glycerol-3-phosphate ABC transporter ATP-binding protein UgpC [Rhodobacter sp.]|nr:sn-glycerol-3-phosphate ABC transporter ATP-binding protein UgpC [Rhodobacter sp.]MCY4168049.1 sn-glycerol-3-phosphate ABC transporter ATP-binding protein UgpC [Rhodobacter sp.]MCY4243153.1 sn-glycerol-3-phosphate ABC transporter ATP-binding protein UgpC [Rhodobacter sp.]